MKQTIIEDLRKKREKTVTTDSTPPTDNQVDLGNSNPEKYQRDSSPQGRAQDQNQLSQTYPADTRPYLQTKELMSAKTNPDRLTNPAPKKEEEKKINALLKETDKQLFSIKGVFPFDFFPDEIAVDLTKVNILRSNFFWTKHIQSILIENIAYVNINMTPFFATMSFVDVSFERNQRIKISYLKKGEALKMRRIIQGLIIARKEGVDFSKFSKTELTAKVEELGNITNDEKL